MFLLLITVAVTSGTVFADSNETPSGSARSSQQGSITLGGDHTCALLSTGSVKCWGLNDLGQLGDGTTTSRSLPVDVLVSLGGSPLTGVTAISAGTSHTCALLSTGSVKCWGYNGDGEFGNGTTTNSSLPVDVLVSLGGSPLTGVSAITAGAYHTCALLSTGSVRCWGLNNYGQIGDGTSGAGTNRLAPTAVLVSLGGSPLTGVSAITAGAYHTCALLSTGSVRCWGLNNYGQIGDGTSGAGTNRLAPTAVLVSLGGSPLTGVSAITAGAYHTCALLSTGS
ncbi:MAG: RCC1 domain-containing protein, partial [Ilumatobacteraceae bacterium]